MSTRRNPLSKREGRNGRDEAPRFFLIAIAAEIVETFRRWLSAAMPYIVFILWLWLIVWTFWCLLDEGLRLFKQSGIHW